MNLLLKGLLVSISRKNLILNVIISNSVFYLQEIRSNLCIDHHNGRKKPFIELYSEELLCHALALSSLSFIIMCNYFLAILNLLLLSLL